MRVPPVLASETIHRFGAELLVAARFLTRLPLGAAEPPEPGALARAAWAFPLIGAGVGIVCALVYGAALELAVPTLEAAFLAVGAGVLLTGALHEDGAADMADGLGGGDRDARLAIMRDSRTGVFGVLALFFSVGLRVGALVTMGSGWEAAAALIAAHAIGRGGVAVALYSLPPARSDGLGAAAGEPQPITVGWALGITLAVAFLMLAWAAGLAALAAAAITMTLIGETARRQLGGQTGDVLGAIEQGGEAATLIAAAAWAP
jgi:adenosylcobinamide-GDP ribazoletransferase